MTPRTNPADRRSEILEAALRCFMRSGYQNTSMDNIVAESGLSKGTIYWHFKNKKELFLALFERVMGEIAQSFELPDPNLSPEEQLRSSLTAIVRIAEEQIELYTIPLSFFLETSEDPEFLARYRAMLEPFATYIQAVLDRGVEQGVFRPVNTHELTWALMAIEDGLLLYHMSDLPGDALQQIELVVDLILRGLRPEGDEGRQRSNI